MAKGPHNSTLLRGRGRTVAGAALLVALVLAAYLPALSAGYVWDDDALLTANPNVRSLEGLGRTWVDPQANTDYYPLTHTSFWVEYHLWKLEPLGYHLDNILLHAAGAVLVWWILRRLAIPGAWVAAAIFAVHPVQVEAVAWVSERKSVLGGFFCLLAVWLFLRVTLAAEDLSTRRRRLLYGLSLLSFACALLARPVVMTAAAVLPLLVWYKHGRLTRRDAFRVAWYWVLAAAMAPVTIWVQYTHVGAAGESFEYSALERLLISGRALWFYLGKLVWPQTLMFAYDKWAIDATAWWQYLYPAGAAAVLAGLVLLRRRLGRGPLVGALVFVIMLLPALGFFNVYWHQYYFVADHMQYLACVGVIAAVVAGAAARLGVWVRPASWGAAIAVLGALAALTWQQCGLYKDGETIWNDTIGKNRDSWMAHDNLAVLLVSQGRLQEAIDHYGEAIRVRPDEAKAYVNRGVAYGMMGEYDRAIRDYDQAIRLSPDDAGGYNNRGNAYVIKGEYDRAIQDFDQAIRVRPDYADVYNNRGNAYVRKRAYDRAIQDYDQAIRLKPGYADAFSDRGVAYVRKGEYDLALRDYDRAIQLRASAEAYYNRGFVYFNKGEYDRAIQDYDQAIQLKPDYVDAYNDRGAAYANKGEYDRAIQDYDQAIRLKPNYADAYNNRAVAYYFKREGDKAWADLKTCSRLGGTPAPELIEALEKTTGRKW
jgi:tetratricopeptide (TPR) repeat protein